MIHCSTFNKFLSYFLLFTFISFISLISWQEIMAQTRAVLVSDMLYVGNGECLSMNILAVFCQEVNNFWFPKANIATTVNVLGMMLLHCFYVTRRESMTLKHIHTDAATISSVAALLPLFGSCVLFVGAVVNISMLHILWLFAKLIHFKFEVFEVGTIFEITIFIFYPYKCLPCHCAKLVFLCVYM